MQYKMKFKPHQILTDRPEPEQAPHWYLEEDKEQ
jgi:hypothetical protein